ncbi:MAG: flagellar export chaperone FliS [Pseudomonadota bacterium]
MNSKHPLHAYRTTGIEGAVMDASPYQLITMLMAGAIDRIAAAKGAMERGDTAITGELIGKTISIVDTMRASLDHTQGGDLAQTLSDLYDYMERRLLQASRENSTEMLLEVGDLLREIKAGWDGIPPEHRQPARA